MNSPQRRRPLGAHDIRRCFLDFFVDRKHEEVESSSLVPRADPTLLFVNAGMVPFKDTFLGRESRDYRRATSVQRVIRAGGKHNDLDNVGFTPRHHTFFEMLGNFSFGDYFKAEAIAWAWEFLTEVLEIPSQRLVVSVFNGVDEAAQSDEEAYELWAQRIDRDRIYKLPAKENFWQMGNTGPCGPCSEIHIFAGDKAPGDATKDGPYGPGYEDHKYLELWNLVFMQYEKQEDGSLLVLPKPSIDTGMGLERLAAVMANVESNYETELIAPFVNYAKSLAGMKSCNKEQKSAFRVIADHARATAFLITDGVFPDRSGRSYVLRRIMRRAIRYGTTVGLEQLFFHQVCQEVVEHFSDAYPEVAKAASTIQEVVQTEEENFRRTLSRGLKRLEVALAELPEDVQEFPIDVAAELYDTYGFPIDLSGVIAKEKELRLDEALVEEEVHRRQFGSEKFVGQDNKIGDVYFDLESSLSTRGHTSNFVGYTEESCDAKVLGLIHEGKIVDVAYGPTEIECAFDQTPFYAESGGQVGDRGKIAGKNSSEIKVRGAVHNTQKPTGNIHIHRIQLNAGSLKVGDVVQLNVDKNRRQSIRRNHSATHLLHHVLRDVLGPHVTQKGSLVEAERLRFDYSHSKALSKEQRLNIESTVNRMILENVPTSVVEMPVEEAKNTGALSLFGEKYGKQVRVVTIARDSVEFCGGTHVERSGDIGVFMIVSDAGIAQGVRRIEAISGTTALAKIQELSQAVEDAQARLRASHPPEIAEKIDKLQSDLKQKNVDIERLQQQLVVGGKGKEEESIQEVVGIRFVVRQLGDIDPKVMRSAADTIRDRLGSGVVVLGCQRGGKANLLVAVTSDLVGRLHAGQLVAKLAAYVDGRGGGKPDLAQAGGSKPAGLAKALAAVGSTIKERLVSE